MTLTAQGKLVSISVHRNTFPKAPRMLIVGILPDPMSLSFRSLRTILEFLKSVAQYLKSSLDVLFDKLCFPESFLFLFLSQTEIWSSSFVGGVIFLIFSQSKLSRKSKCVTVLLLLFLPFLFGFLFLNEDGGSIGEQNWLFLGPIAKLLDLKLFLVILNPRLSSSSFIVWAFLLLSHCSSTSCASVETFRGVTLRS